MSDKPDRSDKFTYRDRRQIVTGKDRERAKARAKARRLLSYVIEQENLDLDKVLALIEANVADLRADEPEDRTEDES